MTDAAEQAWRDWPTHDVGSGAGIESRKTGFLAGYRAGLASPSEELESWDGLMEQLDRHYPADLMANWPDDPGPRIVALIRQIDAIRQEAALRTTKEGR